MKNITLAILAVAVFVVPGVAADISGSWTLTGDIVGNALNMTCTFKQAAEKISGTCSGPAGSVETAGTFTGNRAVFTHTVTQYELTYSGTLDAAGTSMEGEIAVAGVTGTFSAKKAAETPKETASAADIAGTWTIVGEVVGNNINMKCVLARDGSKVTGNCKYEGLGDSPTSGTFEGNKATLQNHVVREQPYDLTYTATLDAAGTSMKGDIAVAGVTGTFSGTKDK